MNNQPSPDTTPVNRRSNWSLIGQSLPVSGIQISSGGEQVAAHLRQGLLQGRWTGELPGRKRLAAELGVSGKIVEAALGLLEREGLLVGHGPRRRRGIMLPDGAIAPRPLRLAILLYEAADRKVDYQVKIQHQLMEAGHSVFVAAKTLVGLDMDVSRVARFVERTAADAWLVVAASRPVLEWFVESRKPVFALFGSAAGLPVAYTAPIKAPAYVAAVRTLAEHGHRRIVLLARPQRRNPKPVQPELAFLNALKAEGITVSNYNFPDWDNTKAGFHRCLASLFHLTPPTALVVQEAMLFSTVQQFLAGRCLRVPQDVSLVCADPDPNFAWCEPTIAHIRWDSAPWIRHIVRWAANLSRGKDDRSQRFSKAEFVKGGTVGPVKGR